MPGDYYEITAMVWCLTKLVTDTTKEAPMGAKSMLSVLLRMLCLEASAWCGRTAVKDVFKIRKDCLR